MENSSKLQVQLLHQTVHLKFRQKFEYNDQLKHATSSLVNGPQVDI